MTNEELREACKSCVTLKVTFKNPETGEEKTFEETGSYFFGGVLTEKDGMSAYSGASMGGADATDINEMHRKILKAMAETTASNKELSAAFVNGMMEEALNERRQEKKDPLAKLLSEMEQRGGADDDEPCQCPICRARRGEGSNIDDFINGLLRKG